MQTSGPQPSPMKAARFANRRDYAKAISASVWGNCSSVRFQRHRHPSDIAGSDNFTLPVVPVAAPNDQPMPMRHWGDHLRGSGVAGLLLAAAGLRFSLANRAPRHRFPVPGVDECGHSATPGAILPHRGRSACKGLSIVALALQTMPRIIIQPMEACLQLNGLNIKRTQLPIDDLIYEN